jgi:hypothetical protein
MGKDSGGKEVVSSKGGSMSFRIAQILVLVLACTFLAPAQHGDAGSGYWPLNYHGDTWTGIVSSFDQGTGTITLTYEHKGKTENFTGVIKPPIQVLDKDGKRVGSGVRINVGDRITAYYMKIEKANSIFQVKLLDQK